MRILFATPEVLDFVQVGGLAAVSAALPRALQGLADIRLIIPGYSQVLAGLKDLTILGSFPAFAGLPAFEVGFGRAVDGLPFYVVVCPGLFERVGSPYGDELRKPRDGLYLPLSRPASGYATVHFSGEERSCVRYKAEESRDLLRQRRSAFHLLSS
jgi:Starch synthase catalytic domain